MRSGTFQEKEMESKAPLRGINRKEVGEIKFVLAKIVVIAFDKLLTIMEWLHIRWLEDSAKGVDLAVN